MALSKYKLGELIEEIDERNFSGNICYDSVVGISTQKTFITTKADLTGVDLTSYKKLYQNYFVYVPDTSRRGDKIALAYNTSEETYLVSAIYTVFKIKDSSYSKILADYLFLYFNRPEFDRYARFHSWGSAREVFSWDDMCEIELELPPIPIQQKYVKIYDSMIQNQKIYEQGLENLKKTCDIYIEKLKKENTATAIGNYIEQSDERNSELKYGKNDVNGMTITKEIIPTKANMNEATLENFIIVKPQSFVYNPRTHGKKIGLGFNNSKESFIITWNNIAFYIKDEAINILLPEYLFLFFKRDEWDRWACFNSWGSSTEVFEWEDLCKTKIPMPDIRIQQNIVNVFDTYGIRKATIKELKTKIKNICPILIKGALEEAAK